MCARAKVYCTQPFIVHQFYILKTIHNRAPMAFGVDVTFPLIYVVYNIPLYPIIARLT